MTLAKHLASKALLDFDAPKHQREEAVMRGFLWRLGVDKSALVKRERPDFLVRIPLPENEIHLCCEITDFFSDKGERGSGGRRFFALWARFAEKLRARLHSEGLDHLYGAIHFKRPLQEAIPGADRFIDEIVIALGSCQGNTINHFNPKKTPLLAQHVDHIFIKDTSPETGTLWWCAHLQNGIVPPSATAIRASVKAKDQAAQSYSWPECREKWLLIYAAARTLVDTSVLVGHITPPIRSVNFTRVFLWDKFSESVCQLYPSFCVVAAVPNIFLSQLPDFLREFVAVNVGAHPATHPSSY